MVEKINQSHYASIKKLLRDKFQDAQNNMQILPEIHDVDSYLDQIMDRDGFFISKANHEAFISFTYVGQMFYSKKGIYTAEWAHYMSDDPNLNFQLLSAVYTYMKENTIKDHIISVFEHRQDLISFMFDLSYGSRCIDAHDKPLSMTKVPGVRLATNADTNVLVDLLIEHHKHMHQPPVCIGMTYGNEEQTIEEWLTNKSVHVREVEGEVVGFMKLSRGSSGGCDCASNKNTLGIETTQIGEKHRGKGYGKSLLDYAHFIAHTENFKVIAVDYEPFNYHAHQFWSKRFEITIRSLIRSMG